ncbi:MAG TPA: hypothetical protein VKC56_07375 [Gallionellaceae bacterium]|nr:hypothetical protein [Gallionellaceae bacterium]
MSWAGRGRAALGAALLLGAQAACADNDLVVYSANLLQGQKELAFYGYDTQDSRSSLNGIGAYNFSVGKTFTPHWKSEIYYGEFDRFPGTSVYLSGYEFENTFHFLDAAQYGLDAGFVASYVYVKQPNQPSLFEFGPLLEKQLGHVNQRLNLIWERQTGGVDRQYVFRAAYSARYMIEMDHSTLSPGMEIYYRPADDAHQIGPMLYDEMRFQDKSELEWSLGVVYGANAGAPARTLMARAEYEFY